MISIIFNKILFICFRERECVLVSGGEGPRERRRESQADVPPSEEPEELHLATLRS